MIELSPIVESFFHLKLKIMTILYIIIAGIIIYFGIQFFKMIALMIEMYHENKKLEEDKY